MKSSPLESKTVRPGLTAYSFYRSDRRPVGRGAVQAKPGRRHGHTTVSLLLLIVVGLGLLTGLRVYQSSHKPPQSGTEAAAVADGPRQCAGNSLGKLIVVSIGERHLWACQYHKVVHDAPVVTGMEKLAADLTPTGTYQIYAKQTDTTLTGSDSTGNWSDPVKYWMPFLDNQYGTYGFHDATWRPDSAFGNISPDSSNASHGCVELPLATSQWLYGWADVGTTVTVKP